MTSRKQAGLIAHIVLVHLVELAADKLGVAVGGSRVLVHEIVDLPLELVCFEKLVDSAQRRISETGGERPPRDYNRPIA